MDLYGSEVQFMYNCTNSLHAKLNMKAITVNHIQKDYMIEKFFRSYRKDQLIKISFRHIKVTESSNFDIQ